MQTQYTLGYSSASVSFVERRRLRRDGDFFLPFLTSGMQVLDCGCGPGSLTCDIASEVNPGQVFGLDAAASQVALARARAARLALNNVRFEVGDVYALPFETGQMDVVFSHALLEHLSDPVAAMREFHRVLKPGGAMGVRAPDWGAFLYSPETPEFLEAIRCFTERQNANGGDVRCGHRLRDYALKAGFEQVRPHATFEVFDPLSEIIDLLRNQCLQQGHTAHVRALDEWATLPGAMFAEAWVSCVGIKAL